MNALEAQAREQAILSLAPQVRLLAGSFGARLPRFMATKDLESEAWIGAIKAVDGFKPERGVFLRTYADRKIRGHIVDYLRSLDFLPRGKRQQIKVLAERVRCLENGPESEALSVAIEELRDATVRTISLDSLGRDISDKNDRFVTEVIARADAGSLLEKMTQNQRMVLMRWANGETSKEIGASLGTGKTYSEHLISHTVREARASLGLTRRPRRIRQRIITRRLLPPTDELKRLYFEEGLSQRQIAERLNFSQEAVSRKLRSAGVHRRRSFRRRKF